MVNNNHKHVCISLENMGSGFFPKRKKKKKRGLIEKEKEGERVVDGRG